MFKVAYLHKKLTRGFVTLYMGRIFEFVALGLINLFVPIYLLISFNARVEFVFLYYLAGAFLYLLLIPLGSQYINIIGINNSLRLSIFFFAFYLICINYFAVNLPLFISLSIFFLTLARITFWMPYNVDIATYTKRKERGKEISVMYGTRTAIGVVTPVISGYLIYKFGFNFTFWIAIAIYISAFFPYLALPETKEKFSWGIRKTFREFFSKKMRKLVLANMANGAENAVGVIIWPIFIWQLLSGNFVEVGAISSLIVLVTVTLQLAAGRFTDSMNKRSVMKMGSIFYALGWIAKVFVLTAGQIFVVGTYHSLAQIFKDTPFDTLTFDILADQGHLVDEYTVLKEMAIQAGKILMLFFVITVSLSFGLNWTFALAAIASLLINVL